MIRQELLESSDATIADAVERSDPMLLRGLLYQLTGDDELKSMAFKRVRVGIREVLAPASETEASRIRKKATAYLLSYRDSGAGPRSIGPRERLKESMSLAVGADIPDDHFQLWLEELALDPWARGLDWQEPAPMERIEKFSVTVIGAGLGGLNAAVQLKRAGFRCTVIEKNSEVGGTWHENRYPGCRVDTPSRSYTHLFGVDFPYPNPYCTADLNERYLKWVADEYAVRPDIIFDTEVRSLVWDDATSTWEVTAHGPDGPVFVRSDAVVTAVGFLNRPKLPAIEGMDEFGGQSWHSARWPTGFDLNGKRVAVIGTGCSGYQMAPVIASDAAHLTLFQRSAQWVFAVPGYTKPFPPQVNWMDRNFPYHTNFMRFVTCFSRGGGDAGPLVDIDPDFHDPYAISPGNKAVRDSCVAFLQQKLDDPDLVARMTPPHPPFSARPVLIDPDDSVLDALLRDNVSLVTDGIRRINQKGVETVDGAQHDVDVIVYATGFRASDYLFPMEIRGRGGVQLGDLWSKDGPRAYLGCMMPGFPNLWSIYGPNTNGGLLVASIHESAAMYMLRCLERLILNGKDAIEVEQEAYERYNSLLDLRGARRAYSDPRSNSYYWSEYGRSVTNCPFSAVEMWRFLSRPDWDDLRMY
jgi:4-hydroxyacetophenone monooxygenase